MCCFFAALVFLGPRFGFLVYWLIAPVRVNAALQAFNFPFLASLLGLVFAPWTMLCTQRSFHSTATIGCGLVSASWQM